MGALGRSATASTGCQHCGKESPLIASALGVCVDCIRGDFEAVRPHIENAHRQARAPFSLPSQPPKDSAGKACRLCINECHVPEGERSYCGLRRNENGRLVGATAQKGNVSWYYDPLPTNCVADWVCPGGTGAGYPQFAYRPGPEHGYKNLAVFYQACSFDCLFCQNWHYRARATAPPRVTPQELASRVDEATACICYFGGDPTPQLPHAILASRMARRVQRILRICWETNGSMHPRLARAMADLSLASGGCIKVDLKAWSPGVHRALCGLGNERTLENLRRLAEYMLPRRREPPPLVASTLLVPGYIEAGEVSALARFLAGLSPDIPYSLLAFSPQFCLGDLPPTPWRQARECLEAAQEAGLCRVRLGNTFLLW